MKNVIFLIFAIFLTSSSCEQFARHEYRIRVRNNSNQTISVYAGYLLPDTLLPINKPNLKEILVGKFGDIHDSDIGDEKFGKLKSERLTIFVLNKDTVEKYDWYFVRNNYKILKRYEFNDKELTDMGGDVIYP